MVLHIDLDYFFAQVEELDSPELKGMPFAVGGVMRRGVICTCNYIARSYGVRAGMPGFKALEVCPQLKILPVIMEKYMKASKKIFDVVASYSDIIEQMSIDEAYLKLNVSSDKEAIEIGNSLKSKIFETTSLTASVGLAKNKLLAKIVGSINKPNGFYFLSDKEIEDFVKKLHVKELPGVGCVILQKLKSLGINWCGDLQKISMQNLIYHFGKFGFNLYSYCRGEDSRELSVKRLERSISVESTTEKDLVSIDECLTQIVNLYERLFSRIDDLTKYRIEGIFVRITDNKFKHSSTSKLSINHDLDYFQKVFKNFYEYKGRPQLRLIGIGVNLKNNLSKQLTLSFPSV